jgi:cytochrome P450
VIDRPTISSLTGPPRTHISFGSAFHRASVAAARLQLKIIWEEILKRFDKFEVVGEPKRVYSSLSRATRHAVRRLTARRKFCHPIGMMTP